MLHSLVQICALVIKFLVTFMLFIFLQPYVASWTLVFPAFSLAITFITAIYLVYFGLTAAGCPWLFWLTRVLCLLSFLGDLGFPTLIILDYYDTVGTIVIAVYFGFSAVEFSASGHLTKKYWRARLLPRTYAPILHECTAEDATIGAKSDAASEIATLYPQLTVESPAPEGLKRSTAKERQRDWNRPEAGALIHVKS